MLFNSYEFLLVFLPLTLAIYAVCGRFLGKKSALFSLVVASLIFYARWNPPYVLLILTSIVFNFLMGTWQQAHIRKFKNPSKTVMIAGVALNIGLLAYYKYANFAVSTVAGLTGMNWTLEHIFLPLALSFFTFTQIAYLVDVWEGKIENYNFLDYCFFVLFFSHLIAGPVVRHHEILPQVKESDGRLRFEFLSVGLTVLAIGLFKKVVFADHIAVYALPAGEISSPPTLVAAWGMVLAYACQLYFDFSGYSDMAIGLGFMFGIRMPLNFNSPYKARSIIDFWRRWHISLSRFLKDYLYVRLGGNRKGPWRRYLNLFITMLLGGLWHGAGWTFVFWGGLHGVYLLINHAWKKLVKGKAWAGSRCMLLFYHLVTFVAVLVAWVFFRSHSFENALMVLKGMIGWNGILLDYRLEKWLQPLTGFLPLRFGVAEFGFTGMAWLLVLLPVIFWMPNTQEIMFRARPALEQPDAVPKFGWSPARGWAVVAGLVLGAALLLMGHVSEFLYFQF